jgi:hypothetical protein
MSAAPTSRGRRFTGWLAYGLFLVALVELSLHVFYRVTTGAFLFARAAQPFYAEEPFGGWVGRPNLSYRHITPEFSVDVFTNSRGLRTSREREEYPHGRDASRYRVLLLGPSFAFGWGVNHEQSFAAELERMLQAAGFAPGRTVEVVNRGVPALPLANGLNWFKHAGRDYAPNLVIQFAYQSMQVSRAAETARVRDSYLVLHEPTLLRRVAAYAKNSATAYYAWTVATILRGRLEPAGTDGRIYGAGREARVAGAFDPAGTDVAESLKVYDDLRLAVEATGARLLLVYFPLAYVVHPEDIDRWGHLGVQDVERQVAFDRAFCRHLDERGIACLNLTPELIDRARQGGRRLYYWLDIHWTPEGNRVAARATADWLLARPQWAK